MKSVRLLLALFLSLMMLVLAWPSFLPGTGYIMLTTPGAQLLALRGLVAVGLFVLGLVILIFAALFFRQARERRRGSGAERAGKVARVTGAIILVGSLLQVTVLWSRGWNNAETLAPDPGISQESAGNGDITVLSFNTLGGQTTPEQLADVIVANGVDVVVLPETSHAHGVELASLLSSQGLDFHEFDNYISQYSPEFVSTVLLVSTALGEYQEVDALDELPAAVVAAPVSGTGPVIYGVHPIAPLPRLIDRWNKETRAVFSVCDEPNFLMAGDFNSTVDHQNAQGFSCADGATEAGAGALGTWPLITPMMFSAPIDRVVHDPEHFQGAEAQIITLGGSDHRGLLVRLRQKP